MLKKQSEGELKISEEDQSSESLVEPVERRRDAPWSAPLEPEAPVIFETPEYKPLEPLEPAMAGAIADSLTTTQIPDLSAYFEQLSQQPEGEGLRMPRPQLKVIMEACPEGLMGFCVNCKFMPCKYVKQRVLRAMLTELAYGVQDKP